LILPIGDSGEKYFSIRWIQISSSFLCFRCFRIWLASPVEKG